MCFSYLQEILQHFKLFDLNNNIIIINLDMRNICSSIQQMKKVQTCISFFFLKINMLFFFYSNNIGSDIPEEVINSFPLEKVRDSSNLLQPGMQCRICLRGYEVGQFIRKLPRCKHKVNHF